jgi:hypothetical protein
MTTITLFGISSFAQELRSTQAAPQSLNLSGAQVFKIQALLSAESTEIRSLNANVQTAREALRAAIGNGDPVVIATAVLSLDAAEKALKNTQLANERNLLSLLSESQKQVVKDYSTKAIPASD